MSKCNFCEAKSISFINRKIPILLGSFGYSKVTVCVKHLSEIFSNSLENYQDKVILIFSDPDGEVSYSYEYYPVKHSEYRKQIESGLNLIEGVCRNCKTSQAQIAIYQASYSAHYDFDFLNTEKPSFLCKKCSRKHISEYFEKNGKFFGMGVDLPFGGEGMAYLRIW